MTIKYLHSCGFLTATVNLDNIVWAIEVNLCMDYRTFVRKHLIKTLKLIKGMRVENFVMALCALEV